MEQEIDRCLLLKLFKGTNFCNGAELRYTTGDLRGFLYFLFNSGGTETLVSRLCATPLKIERRYFALTSTPKLNLLSNFCPMRDPTVLHMIIK